MPDQDVWGRPLSASPPALAALMKAAGYRTAATAANSLHPRFRRDQRAMYSGAWKLILSTNRERELYRLDQDRDERHNLFGRSGTPGESLVQALEAWG